MATTIKVFALTPGGLAVAALANGQIVEEVPRSSNAAGKYDTDWRDVPVTGLAGRVVQLAARYDGRLVALTTSGLFTLAKTGSGFASSWEPVTPPAEPG
ncbi:MAG TPA: hypothetical protein VHW66_21875 [Stellaceae bacterium]|jgi:hypothetical protein|nr:hypothetical protein [Stellaceae bacterium]